MIDFSTQDLLFFLNLQFCRTNKFFTFVAVLGCFWKKNCKVSKETAFFHMVVYFHTWGSIQMKAVIAGLSMYQCTKWWLITWYRYICTVNIHIYYHTPGCDLCQALLKASPVYILCKLCVRWQPSLCLYWSLHCQLCPLYLSTRLYTVQEPTRKYMYKYFEQQALCFVWEQQRRDISNTGWLFWKIQVWELGYRSW